MNLAYYLCNNEGLLIGPSSSINIEGALRLAAELGPEHTICTIICDNDSRYISKMFNHEYLQENGIVIDSNYTPEKFVNEIKIRKIIDKKKAWKYEKN